MGQKLLLSLMSSVEDREPLPVQAALAEFTQQTGIEVKETAMREFCHRHQIRPYRPTYRYLRADPERQAQATQPSMVPDSVLQTERLLASMASARVTPVLTYGELFTVVRRRLPRVTVAELDVIVGALAARGESGRRSHRPCRSW